MNENILDLRQRALPSASDLAGAAIRLAMIAAAEQQPSSRRASLAETTVARVKQQILKNLRDPELSLERLAETIGCTKRCLHKAFEEESHTLSEFIWNSRLDQCRKEILDSNQPRCPLTSIAFSWGFNSAAHFSRVFRARFAISPSEMRKRALDEHAVGSTANISLCEFL